VNSDADMIWGWKAGGSCLFRVAREAKIPMKVVENSLAVLFLLCSEGAGVTGGLTYESVSFYSEIDATIDTTRILNDAEFEF
jgi:hypothetical protein